MRRVFVIAAASLGLAGCSSMSSLSLDSLKPAPTPVTVQLDSVPPGADARTSLGPSCKTPCSVPVTADGSFSVSFMLDKYMPATVPVQVTKTGGDFLTAATTTIDPNPVVAELQPATKPTKRPVRKMVKRRKSAPSPSAGAPPADAAPVDAGPPPTR
jgi:hypothetical protein